MSHSRIDDRSLAFGRLIAERLAADPGLMRQAEQTLDRWSATCDPRSATPLSEWRQALRSSVVVVILLLTGTDERSVRLRQSNPFAGVLTPAERTAVLRRFPPHDPLPT